jgi:predicted Rossmann-fold nucleotide-binding protein
VPPIGRSLLGPPEGAFSANPGRLGDLLEREIVGAHEFGQRCRRAFTFFGGARVDTADPYFAQGKRWGEAIALMNLAGHGAGLLERAAGSGLFSPEACRAAQGAVVAALVGELGADEFNARLRMVGGLGGFDRAALPRQTRLILRHTGDTGAGPGMMDAVPLGIMEARARLISMFPHLAHALTAETRTQGARIAFYDMEQKTSPSVEKVEMFEHFLPRRAALIAPGAGFVCFPGGFGTLNEAFEVLRAKHTVLLDGRPFWTEIRDRLVSSWEARGFVSDRVLDRIELVDGPAEGLPELIRRAQQVPHDWKTRALVRGAEMAAEAKAGVRALTSLPPAVTFIGSRRLGERDREVDTAGRLAEILTRDHVPIRIGGDGPLLRRLSTSVRAADPSARLQALLLDEGQLDPREVEASADVAHVVHHAPVHKLLLYENTDAIVAAPGGVGTFDEVFEVATLMQTRKIPKRPLILIGREFWQPILDALKRAMFSGERQMIAENDMRLFQVVDDEHQAAEIIRRHRAGLAFS